MDDSLERAVPGRAVRGRSGLLAAGLGVVAVLGLAALQPAMYAGIGGLFDFLPLYYGAQSLLDHGDAYLPHESAPSLGPLTDVGNVYPLHAVLLFGLPLAGFPPAAAGTLWVVIVGLAWIAAIAWAREGWTWLLWLPMWDALRMQQTAAPVTVATIVALGALRRGSRAAFVLALLVMLVKPQQTLVLVVALLWWGREWWRWVVVGFGSAAVVCFVVQPDWVQRWFHHIALRNADIAAAWWPSLLVLALGAWLLVRGWRVPGLAVLSTAAAPWPLGGLYVPSAWPIGTDQDQGVSLALVGTLAIGAALVVDSFWVFPVVLCAGLALAAWRIPRATAPMPSPR